MSEMLNKKYTIELEVLTPLHVGVGSEKDWMKGADYIEDKEKIYVLSHKKLLNKIFVEELTQFLLTKDDKGLKKKIHGSLKEVSDFVFISPAKTSNDIKTFAKNGLTNKPFVPGSSIKGAIRSILLEYFMNGNKPKKLNEKEYFGSANDGDEFMRFIKISDAQFEKTELVNTKIFNLYGTAPNLNGGWKHSGKNTNKNFEPSGFNTIYEVIKPGEKGELNIALSDKTFDNFYKNNKPAKKSEIVHKEPSKKLFAIINEHTRKHIDKEIDFFKKYPNNETPYIIENLERVLKQIPDDNSSCVLKMSAGSGFHSITGDWQFDDFSINQIDSKKRNRGKFNGKPSAKSRKIAIDGDNFYLMGFIKLSILSEEMIAKREEERKAKFEAERKAELERIAQEKAEQERIEAEKQAKAEAERKAEEERIAREKAEQEERARLLKQREEEEKHRQEVNKSLLEKGLNALNKITDYNKGKNLIDKLKKRNSGIDKSQFSIIKNFVIKHFHVEDKDWNNFRRGKRWKEIKGWVGLEIAQQWFNELMQK
jgi:CRISPR/Cas system CSM-associated protein Csm5 (group 7 of RAMP superfamily)